MVRAQTSRKTAPGRPFRPGTSGNPGGRPKGLARITREAVGDDGREIAEFWLDVMRDRGNQLRLRLDASKLLAEHGWGKPAGVEHIMHADMGTDGGPISDGVSEDVVQEFYAELDRLGSAS